MLVRAMHEDGVDIWGDGSTFKGNDIERFYRYGLLANPDLRIYKPWLDADFVHELGGRHEMSQWLTAHDLPYRDSTEKAYSTDANIWGATHEAKTLEHLDVSLETVSRSWACASGTPPSRSSPRTSRSGSTRAARSPSTARRTPTRSPWSWRPTTIGGRHGLGMSDQIENRIIEAKSRGIYEAPGMALLWIAYERLLNAIHNEDTLAELPRPGPPARPAALRGPLARPAGADAARVGAALGRLAGHRRGDAAAAARRGLHRSCAPTARRSPTTPTSCRWSAWSPRRSGRPTGSASSPCATSTSPTRAPSSSSTPPSRSTRARCWSSTGTCSARCRPAAPTRIAANPALDGDTSDDALDNAAMEFGTD